jgi:hypothetical protein
MLCHTHIRGFVQSASKICTVFVVDRLEKFQHLYSTVTQIDALAGCTGTHHVVPPCSHLFPGLCFESIANAQQLIVKV